MSPIILNENSLEHSLNEGAAHRRLQEEAVGDSDTDRENEGIREDGDRGLDLWTTTTETTSRSTKAIGADPLNKGWLWRDVKCFAL